MGGVSILAQPARFESKILDPLKLEDFARICPRPLVFTNGVYDLLHRGHVSLLDAAAQQGRCLILALNSDDSVRRLGKGADRPINTLGDRMAVAAALASVDHVTWFEEDSSRLVSRLTCGTMVADATQSSQKVSGPPMSALAQMTPMLAKEVNEMMLPECCFVPILRQKQISIEELINPCLLLP